MPNKDGTGPAGKGCGTGRGRGPCGCGRAFGRRNQDLTKEEQKKVLVAHKEEIEHRIKELE